MRFTLKQNIPKWNDKQTTKQNKTKQTNKGLSSLSKLVKIYLYQICLEQKRCREVQTTSQLKCTLAGKCGLHIPSLPLVTLLVCASLHHICPNQIWCKSFSFNARYFRTHIYAKKTFLRLWNCQILNLDSFCSMEFTCSRLRESDRDNCPPLPEQASLIFARLVFVTSKAI